MIGKQMGKQDKAFTVGEYVADSLKEKGWTIREAVAKLEGDKKSHEVWLTLISLPSLYWSHNIVLSQTEAAQLETIFGVSAQTWLNIHDRFLASKKASDATERKSK